MSIDELLSQVWAGVIVTPDSVYQAITSLRRQLGDDPKQPSYVATVPRLGYKMIATVSPWVDTLAVQTATPVRATPVPPTATSQNRHKTFGGVAAIVLALVAAYLIHGHFVSPSAAARTSPPPHSIAVLPFLDLTTQEMNEEYFADGMTEELIGDLGKVPGLRVPAPTSSFYFKGKQLPVADIARRLGVIYILDGSVRKSGDTFRVAARLLRADDGYILWTDTYDRSLGNIVNVQKDVATEVTKAVHTSIAGAAAAR